MPVTIRTQPISGEPWREGVTNDPTVAFCAAANTEVANVTRHMQDSFSADTMITPSINGLVGAAVAAWNTHHHLVLRPDDIWIAIISQLGFYIDAHAEELRKFFVAHKGQKELTVEQFTDPAHADYGMFAQQMSEEISKNVNDPTLVPWITPNFSTTTDTDRVAIAVLLMGAMKKYFKYNFSCIICGIPSVTLLGERSDWVDLESRIQRIPELKGETVDFYRLLAPIARHMVLSFDAPESPAVIDFWRAVTHWERYDSRICGHEPVNYISGWITAFCFWDNKGSRNNFIKRDVVHEIDGVVYESLSEESKTGGWAAVPVKVNVKDGSGRVLDKRDCRMVAGSIGMRPGRHSEMGVLLDGPETALAQPVTERPLNPAMASWHPNAPPASEGLDAVQPYVGWWIFEGEEKTEKQDWEEPYNWSRKTDQILSEYEQVNPYMPVIRKSGFP